MPRNQFSITKQIIEANLKKSHGLTVTDQSVLVTLSSYFGTRGNSNTYSCYPSQDRIAEQVGCTRSTVNNALQKLERLGFISSSYRGTNTSKLYTWLGIPTLEEEETEDLSSASEQSDAVSSESQTGNDSDTENSDALASSIVNAVQLPREQHLTTSDWWTDFAQEELEVGESPF
ncbi:TPA: helix-turn-helix domain-containing protein [Vibrio parahaemolyticus]|uniref:helix-turn-helix domain-containing protein n=1 Tax=Vibrio parahaemolyticus TaxID=670 RepID=UPI00112060FB|nr:helix-turn-helix domain-containing protein [Vibrio parahaemolyticus]EIJ0973297.1 helix-turn-helix domain-containing protein [Vibrio parahaemolyticus]EIU7002315.1 helix-turn-helix domain-containing protein [Vibrio parahaemolyticus]EJG1083534.1 helix-turn-helix domain-containing protein [Vibrio parahaemolyticus]MBM4897474.1 helix-turn-helix domain-containing protein [Vibrio parahaemolyticus]MDF4473664.1 helix-turn-helix domain-containing protein [Vibrio parahaemolyticus]